MARIGLKYPVDRAFPTDDLEEFFMIDLFALLRFGVQMMGFIRDEHNFSIFEIIIGQARLFRRIEAAMQALNRRKHDIDVLLIRRLKVLDFFDPNPFFADLNRFREEIFRRRRVEEILPRFLDNIRAIDKE